MIAAAMVGPTSGSTVSGTNSGGFCRVFGSARGPAAADAPAASRDRRSESPQLLDMTLSPMEPHRGYPSPQEASSPYGPPHDRGRVDGIEQPLRFARREHGRLALADHDLRSLHGCGGVHSQHAPGHEIIEQSADRREVLPDRQVAVVPLKLLDVGGDEHRLRRVKR